MLLAGANLASQSIRDDYEQGGAMSKELEAQLKAMKIGAGITSNVEIRG